MNNQVSKPTSDCASDQRQQEAFREPLLKQANAPRAKRRPHCKFVVACPMLWASTRLATLARRSERTARAEISSNQAARPDIMNLQIAYGADLKPQHFSKNGGGADSTKLRKGAATVRPPIRC